TPDVTRPIRYMWDFSPIAGLTGSGSVNPYRTRVDSIIYEAPSLSINPVLPTAPGIEATVSWDFTVENNSNAADATNTWFGLVSPSGQVVPIQVIDLDNSVNMTPSGGIYQIGLIQRDSSRAFRVVANYNNCAMDSLRIVSGWDCGAFPSSLGALNCTPVREMLYIDPQPAELQANLTLTPSGPFNMCDSFLVELNVVSSQTASLRNIRVQVALPLSGGLTYNPGTTELLYPMLSTFGSVADPVITGNLLRWTINSISPPINTNDLPGVVKPDSNAFTIRFYLTTNCNMVSGERFVVRLRSEQVCGDPLPPTILLSDPIDIVGATQPYSTVVDAQPTQNAACPMNYTFAVEVINAGLGSTSTGDSIFVDLGPGYSYAGNFAGLNNPPSNVAPTVQSGPGGLRLGWESLPGLTPVDTIAFTFDVDVSDAVACGPDVATVQTVVNSSVFCAATSSFCSAASQTGSYIMNLNIDRANLSFSAFNSTLQPIGGGYD
ncbi:MAG: hypothetical protein AAF570_23015, partial [Bacteroidota bacterium]